LTASTDSRAIDALDKSVVIKIATTLPPPNDPAKRKEYDTLAAEFKLNKMGFPGSGVAVPSGAGTVQVTGPVLESELGIPEYARGAHEFQESLIKRGLQERWNPKEPRNRNQVFAARVLERFDKAYAQVVNPYTRQIEGLLHEARLLQEAELSTDLNLPYSASRAIIAAAMANLVSSGVFDFDTIETNPTYVFYEAYAEDDTVTTTVAMGEAVALSAAASNTWNATAKKRIIPGMLTVKDSGETITYTKAPTMPATMGTVLSRPSPAEHLRLVPPCTLVTSTARSGWVRTRRSSAPSTPWRA